MKRHDSAGFSLIEMLVALMVIGLIATALATLMVHYAKINKTQQMFSDTQINARAGMQMIMNRLYAAGWDPINAGIDTVRTDPNLSDDVSQLEIFADFDEDGLTTAKDEQVLIRHAGDRIEWRRTADSTEPFTIVATQISNDADGDGIVEPMFQPDDPLKPKTIVVQITARSSAPDPRTGEFIRYTLRTEVALRNQL